MMKKTAKNEYAIFLVFLCSAVYFVSYLTRINYAAVMVEITKDLNISKTAASLALTASAVSYGFGQIISGYLGDKFRPERIILFGLICTSAMNLLIPVTAVPAYMSVIWFVNGFAQAMMWPPIVKIMTSLLSDDEYKKGCIRVSWGSSFATIFVYIATPLFIHFSNWRAVFVFSAVCAAVMCIVWIFGFGCVKNKLVPNRAEGRDNNITATEKFTPGVFCLLAVFLAVVAIQGSLRDGVTNWMPSYISETFNLGSEIAILSNVILPIVSLFLYSLTLAINKHFIKNECLCMAAIFGLGTVFALIFAIFGSKNAVLATVTASVLAGTMHGVNYCQTCLSPVYFAKYGKVSLVSGIINSGTYIGSSISTYGIAYLTKTLSWNQIAYIWCAIAALGAIVCAAMSGAWGRFTEKEN